MHALEHKLRSVYVCAVLLAASGFWIAIASAPATAQQPQKPNILFIMGDDIG